MEFGVPREALSSNWNILSFSVLPGEHLSLQASAGLTFPNPQGWVANCPSGLGVLCTVENYLCNDLLVCPPPTPDLYPWGGDPACVISISPGPEEAGESVLLCQGLPGYFMSQLLT